MLYKNMNSDKIYISEKRWKHLLSTLSKEKINSLGKTLKIYQTEYQLDEMITVSSNKENDDFDDLDAMIKTEPVINSTQFYKSHKTKNRGLTYENGRRNLKAENVAGEEKERRAKRRERNRVAAQKCRERRQQQIDELQYQVELLRSTEKKLSSTLNKLSDEENDLRIKLASHNCIISESSTGSLSFLIQRNLNNNSVQYNQSMYFIPSETPTTISTYSSYRPNSLSLPCQTYPCNTTDFASNIEQYTLKDESLTSLFSPENYIIQTENMTTALSQTSSSEIESHETETKIAFSWSNSIIEQLSMPCLEQSANLNDLSTPTVDIPFYSFDSFSQSMNWHTTSLA